MTDLTERAISLLARLLVEKTKPLPWGWSIAPDPRDGSRRNEPTEWVLGERWTDGGGKIDDELADAIRAEQRRIV